MISPRFAVQTFNHTMTPSLAAAGEGKMGRDAGKIPALSPLFRTFSKFFAKKLRKVSEIKISYNNLRILLPHHKGVKSCSNSS